MEARNETRTSAIPRPPRIHGTHGPHGIHGTDGTDGRARAAQAAGTGAPPTLDAWARELAVEVERLRGELARERARGRARAAELEALESALRGSLGRTGPGSGAAPDPERLAQVADRIERAQRALGGVRGGLGPAALLAALLMGFTLRPLVLPVSAKAAPLPAAHAHVATRDEPPRGPTRAASGAAERALEDGTDDVPTAAPAESVAAAPPVEGRTSAVASAPASVAAGVAALGPAAAFAGRLTAREVAPLAYAPQTGAPCAFRGRGADLGPCLGPAAASGDGVAATHRVDGVECCHHHLLAQRLGGDVEALSDAAELARREGTLPPLVAARIDRAAALFLRARCGPWRAAGVDAPQAEGHRARLADDGVATLDTWLEPAIGAPDVPSPRVALRLVLELSEGPEGDVLRELAFVSRPAPGAAPTSREQ